MGAIGRWIDERCAEEPDVMRRVLHKKFGSLGAFVEDGGKCGCLIGTYWLITRKAQCEYGPEGGIGIAVFDLTLWGAESSEAKSPKRPDAAVIRLVKQRIRKSLGIAVPSAEEVLV